MSVSAALERSAKVFCSKYACSFSFAIFEERIEEFTFLRPIGGWVDVYKATFERMYRQALASFASVRNTHLNGEEMLDDFEYTLIRPYVKEGDKEIQHKPYVGMDRIARLEYLTNLTREAPSNVVELYADNYKRGKLSLRQMLSVFNINGGARERYSELTAYVQALESVNQSRSSLWRFLHPFKNNAERRDCARMKTALMQETAGDESFYRGAVAKAYEPFGEHQRVISVLEEGMVRERKEILRKQKMSDAMRASMRFDGVERDAAGQS